MSSNTEDIACGATDVNPSSDLRATLQGINDLSSMFADEILDAVSMEIGGGAMMALDAWEDGRPYTTGDASIGEDTGYFDALEGLQLQARKARLIVERLTGFLVRVESVAAQLQAPDELPATDAEGLANRAAREELERPRRAARVLAASAGVEYPIARAAIDLLAATEKIAEGAPALAGVDLPWVPKTTRGKILDLAARLAREPEANRADLLVEIVGWALQGRSEAERVPAPQDVHGFIGWLGSVLHAEGVVSFKAFIDQLVSDAAKARSLGESISAARAAGAVRQ